MEMSFAAKVSANFVRNNYTSWTFVTKFQKKEKKSQRKGLCDRIKSAMLRYAMLHLLPMWNSVDVNIKGVPDT